ncbi:hypothetical protein HHK36_004874 [Tetracentron sinense]|uniref:Non-specific lipid-transfer protein n=2 Tax=Tetracentron sinense TaxID=13715 RepID=A0A834ZNI0_TETSI|nr:hypothetical protein HHK36_004874 [Tetracentron sinense]
MKGVGVCVLMVLAMAQLMVEPTNGFTCVDVAENLVQCVNYLTGADAKPVQGCCDGVKRVKGECTTTEEKRLACNCIKQAATRIHNIKDSAVTSLADACGAPLPFPVSTTFDCNSIP